MKGFIFGALAACSGFVFAQAGDPRIDVQRYDKLAVYKVRAQVGKAMLIQVEEGETLTGSPASVLGMGDAEAWDLKARGNNIIFKPSQAKPQTNMIFVTNKRRYVVDLEMVGKGGTPTYVLSFVYPDTEAAKVAQEAAAAKQEAHAVAAAAAGKQAMLKGLNLAYKWRGENAALAPSGAWDDGRFTRFVYDHAGELPVFFKVLPDGSEALINSHVEGNTVVFQEVVKTIRVRLGNDVIEVINGGYQLPSFNATGSGVPGEVRILKGLQ